jgi:LmbE family N-acetylglucosaminyl deacetylase
MTSDNGTSGDFSRAMVVIAHPDDAEYGCSASVAKWCRLGWEVVYVLCTDGSKGSEDREVSSGQLAELREKEQREAGKILGLQDVVFLGYPDGYLEPTLEVRKDISREIRRWKPDVLITSSPTRDLTGSTYIGHPDHFAAGEAALSAVFPSARDHLTFPELLDDEGLDIHKVNEVWVMSFGTTANFWNPLEEQDVATSIAALGKHASQVSNIEESAKWMKQRRAELGKQIGADYAESFRKFSLG